MENKNSSISIIFGKGFTVSGVTGVVDVTKVDMETGAVEAKGSVKALSCGKTSIAKRLFR